MKELTLITPDHLHSVALLEKECFADPWSESALQLLCKPHALGLILPPAENEACAKAYAGMTYALDEASVTNVAVRPDCRRQGLARCLMLELMHRASQQGAERMYLEVRASNDPAIALYRSLGFETCGRRPHFYQNPTEDALLMCASLD